MIHTILFGCCGNMGAAVARAAQSGEVFTVTAGIDCNAGPAAAAASFPIYDTIPALEKDHALCERADVIIDFSHHTAVSGLLNFAEQFRIPTVIATTGHTAEELNRIHDAAKQIPVFYSRNMSLGINLLLTLVRQAAAALRGYDIEIVEKHHRRKLDAPSGTALMLAEAAAQARKESTGELPAQIFDRSTRRQTRPDAEIGIASVRGGTIVGEHEVIFAGTEEVVTLSHRAESRSVFAEGALRAAAFLQDKPAGLYSMEDLVREAGGTAALS